MKLVVAILAEVIINSISSLKAKLFWKQENDLIYPHSLSELDSVHFNKI